MAVFTIAREEVCKAVNSDTEPRDIEGMRSKLKKLAACGTLTEPSPGLFRLVSKKAT